MLEFITRDGPVLLDLDRVLLVQGTSDEDGEAFCLVQFEGNTSTSLDMNYWDFLSQLQEHGVKMTGPVRDKPSPINQQMWDSAVSTRGADHAAE